MWSMSGSLLPIVSHHYTPGAAYYSGVEFKRGPVQDDGTGTDEETTVKDSDNDGPRMTKKMRPRTRAQEPANTVTATDHGHALSSQTLKQIPVQGFQCAVTCLLCKTVVGTFVTSCECGLLCGDCKHSIIQQSNGVACPGSCGSNIDAVKTCKLPHGWDDVCICIGNTDHWQVVKTAVRRAVCCASCVSKKRVESDEILGVGDTRMLRCGHVACTQCKPGEKEHAPRCKVAGCGKPYRVESGVSRFVTRLCSIVGQHCAYFGLAFGTAAAPTAPVLVPSRRPPPQSTQTYPGYFAAMYPHSHFLSIAPTPAPSSGNEGFNSAKFNAPFNALPSRWEGYKSPSNPTLHRKIQTEIVDRLRKNHNLDAHLELGYDGTHRRMDVGVRATNMTEPRKNTFRPLERGRIPYMPEEKVANTLFDLGDDQRDDDTCYAIECKEMARSTEVWGQLRYTVRPIERNHPSWPYRWVKVVYLYSLSGKQFHTEMDNLENAIEAAVEWGYVLIGRSRSGAETVLVRKDKNGKFKGAVDASDKAALRDVIMGEPLRPSG